MQRSSNSIASLAAALAKAQVELVNPEKSLVGTIYADGAGQERRSFNYASLASGLDIVRTTLGQHEIATVQTTAIDQSAGVVSLTTVLAHSSGEWIASDWPVCAVSDTATPRRMGAALTYARRYALFALVGIAGEDDLDAPDLQMPPTQASAPKKAKEGRNGHLNGGRTPSRHDANGPGKSLGPQESSQLRERLLAELDALGSADDATNWAHRCLPEKNKLTAADAALVEEAFRAKLAGLAPPAEESLLHAPETPEQFPPSHGDYPEKPNRRRRSKAIDKSALALAVPRRVRDREHVKFVAGRPCLICGRQPCDAHHLRFAQSRALGRKVSDEFTVPLCRGHHREVHRYGDEAEWWGKVGIDPIGSARALWLRTHPLPPVSDKLVIEDVAITADSADQSEAERLRPARKQAPNYKTKPIIAAGSA
ncbi:ERF family protein [Bradyrhizobium sp.]|uniref:ERF family protein n=1 Tax=Bradyrhizobium sp. TaxID=376 RepID=UPI003C65A9BF